MVSHNKGLVNLQFLKKEKHTHNNPSEARRNYSVLKINSVGTFASGEVMLDMCGRVLDSVS